MGKTSRNTRSSEHLTRSAPSSARKNALERRVWMSRRWGIGMPVSSFPNEMTGRSTTHRISSRSTNGPAAPPRPRVEWEPGGARLRAELSKPTFAHTVSLKKDHGLSLPIAGRRHPRPLLQFDSRALLFQLRLDGFGLVLRIASLTAARALSTSSLASLRPSDVTSRTTLMTWIFLRPAREHDVELGLLFGRGTHLHPPAGPPRTGAAAIVTLNFSLKSSIRSANSMTDMSPIASRISLYSASLSPFWSLSPDVG